MCVGERQLHGAERYRVFAEPGQPELWRDHDPEQDDRRADRHHGDGVPEAPGGADQRRARDAALATDDGRDGDESRLSPQLQVDITLHFETALDKATGAVGDTVTITGQHFGVFNASTDSVTAPTVSVRSTFNLPAESNAIPACTVFLNPANSAVTE